MTRTSRSVIALLSLLVVVGTTALAAPIPGADRSARLRTIRAKLLSPKIRGSVPMLFERSAGEPISVLVYLLEKADLSGAGKLGSREARGRHVYDALREVARRSQRPLRELLVARGVAHTAYYVTNMVAVENASPELVAELAARPDVAHVSANPQVKNDPIVPVGTPDFRSLRAVQPPGTNIDATGAPRVWTELGVRGEKIVVAGQDTGVEWDHPALKASYRGHSSGGAQQAETVSHDYHWHDAVKKPLAQPGNSTCGYASAAPCDDGGGSGMAHGTHTMGTVVGDGGLGNEIGMAPKARWIACRNMDHGVGRPNFYIECFEFFLAPYPRGGDPMADGDPARAPHVINNSWGCPPEEGCEGDEIKPVLEALEAAGILVVVSAGNSGPGCSTIQDPPAWHSASTLSVGAVDHRTGRIAGFSSRGPSSRDGEIGPDVTAPGVNIRSAVTGGRYDSFFWSGTSMAGPHVAGLVALMWSAQPALIGDVAATGELIRRTADPKTTLQACGTVQGNSVPNNTYGHGVINAWRAVSEARR